LTPRPGSVALGGEMGCGCCYARCGGCAMLLSTRISGLRQLVDPLADACAAPARWPDALPHTTGPCFLCRLVRPGVQRPGRRAEGQVSRDVSINHACALAARVIAHFTLSPRARVRCTETCICDCHLFSLRPMSPGPRMYRRGRSAPRSPTRSTPSGTNPTFIDPIVGRVCV